jgi:Amt family ammonium transporter
MEERQMEARARRAVARGVPLLLLFQPGVALAREVAETGSAIDSGDTAWILICSAIVLMMTAPGLALFYGGLVRGKNVLSILMQCFVTLALVSVTWVLWGYSLAFGPDHAGLIGDLSWFGLRGVGLEPGPYADTVPHQAFMVFQLMFAAITPALITGAFAERMKFSAFLAFVLLWSTFIYAPLAHWVWGGGWLGARGALDFAGGTVVHISSGVSALVAAAVIGRRRGFGRDPMPPHSLPLTLIGASLLWVGWFGFNAGSALAADATATLAFVTTNTATGAAVLGWMVSEWIGRGRPTMLGAASGAVAGLVAITPAAGFVEPWAAIVIGLVAGFLCYKACNWKSRVGYDDALDVVGIHGVGGTWGALATGLLATDAGWLTASNFPQFMEQGIAVLATYALAGFGTLVVLGFVNSIFGLRVDDEDEELGLDLALHSESAYTLTPSSAIGERSVSRAAAAEPTTNPAPAPAAPKPSKASTASSPGNSTTSRTPPRSSGSISREPPRYAAPGSQSSGTAASRPGTFRVLVEGIDRGWLSRWWRELCNEDFAKQPQALRDIHPNLISCEGGVYTFRGEDPRGTRDRLAYLLEIYGAQEAEVRLEGVS